MRRPKLTQEQARENYERQRALAIARLESMKLPQPVPIDVAAAFLPTKPEWDR